MFPNSNLVSFWKESLFTVAASQKESRLSGEERRERRDGRLELINFQSLISIRCREQESGKRSSSCRASTAPCPLLAPTPPPPAPSAFTGKTVSSPTTDLQWVNSTGYSISLMRLYAFVRRGLRIRFNWDYISIKTSFLLGVRGLKGRVEFRGIIDTNNACYLARASTGQR